MKQGIYKNGKIYITPDEYEYKGKQLTENQEVIEGIDFELRHQIKVDFNIMGGHYVFVSKDTYDSHYHPDKRVVAFGVAYTYTFLEEELRKLLSDTWDECQDGNDLQNSMYANIMPEPTYLPLDKDTFINNKLIK